MWYSCFRLVDQSAVQGHARLQGRLERCGLRSRLARAELNEGIGGRALKVEPHQISQRKLPRPNVRELLLRKGCGTAQKDRQGGRVKAEPGEQQAWPPCPRFGLPPRPA